MVEVEKIREILRKVYGEFNSYLEKKYEEKLVNILVNGTAYDKYKWITYNQILIELRLTKKDENITNELLYKLTEDGDPTNSCITFLDELGERNKELDRLYDKLINFK